MSKEYLYGAYGKLGQTVAQSVSNASTVSVYVGLAPVNLIRGYADAEVINTPVRLSNMPNVQNTVGYSADWNKFSLCEVFAAHFENLTGNVGPIYVINVLNPAVHKKEVKINVSLSFVNGQATIKSDTIILDTLALAEKAEGTDYTVDYNYNKGTVVISSIGDTKITGSVDATYEEIDISNIDESVIIGKATEMGEYAGIGAIQLVYTKFNKVPNLIAAPGWSEKKSVYDALVKAANNINGHWNAFVVADIPVKDAESNAVDTIAKALKYAKDNGINSENSKAFWPMAKGNDGKLYHLSTFGVVEYMRADSTHSGVPMETCGNKKIPVVAQYFGEGSTNKGFDQKTANSLTSKGFGTCVFWGGNWVLWGDHTAAYDFDVDDIDPRCIFDVSMRMLYHIINNFQLEWGTDIDEPFTKQLKDRIINREQEKLDALVAMGALIGKPEVLFLESENPVSNMMTGDFIWDIPVTPTPPLKSATARVAYTDAGFSAYYG